MQLMTLMLLSSNREIRADAYPCFSHSVSDVLNYAGEGKKKFIEGENIVNFNHLMYCSIFSHKFF